MINKYQKKSSAASNYDNSDVKSFIKNMYEHEKEKEYMRQKLKKRTSPMPTERAEGKRY